LYYFALAHQADFDVRWCRGPIGTLIFEPLVQKLKSMGIKILGGRRVQEILPADGSASARPRLNPAAAAAAFGKTLAGRVVAKGVQGSTETFDADAVVLAAGVPALQQMVRSSRLLGSAPDLAASMGLDCSDVLAVRLWLDRKVQLRTPSNVVAGFDEGVGGTLFQLDELQVRLTEV
jgi:phytoene dehydrogenase-like protein